MNIEQARLRERVRTARSDVYDTIEKAENLPIDENDPATHYLRAIAIGVEVGLDLVIEALREESS